MTRITNLGPSIEMTQYYIKRKSLEAYYSDNQEFNGYWGGKAAKMLGLEGHITELEFSRLSENLHPKTGERLTSKMNPARRSGFDITFDCPKSVSLVYAHSRDDRIIWAMRQAVSDISNEIEQSIATRVRAGLGKSSDKDRTTGNFATAEIIHLTARPENGFPDPHLHLHLVVFNATLDPVEKKWKAIQMGDVHEEMPYYQAAFHMKLAENLKKLGLDIVPTKDAFEIAGIPRDLIEKFSRRTKKINETAERLGITDPAQKAKLGALTRERKNKSLLLSELAPFWWHDLAPEHEEALKAAGARLQRSLAVELSSQMVETKAQTHEAAKIRQSSGLFGTKGETESAKKERRESVNKRTRPGPMVVEDVEPTKHDRRAVALAIQHTFERASAVTEKQLIGEAFRSWCIGRATVAGIEKVIAETPFLRRERNGKMFVTTQEVLDEENHLIEQCLNGKWKHEPLNPFWQIEDETVKGPRRKAVEHLLTSRDWVIGVAGKAGTGKTTLLREVRRGVEAGMHKVIALAPTSEAARDTLRKEGFENADTVARFLVSESLQNEARGGVLLVDEAGLLPTRQAKRLFDLTQELDARLILIGDTGQHHAVERGQAFDLLEKFAHLSVARVEDVVRQKGTYKRIVEYVGAKDVKSAIELAKETDVIKEMSIEERKVALARDYVDALERGKTALVVAPTHAECDDVTEGIREALKEKKKLTESVKWDILRNLAWTEAEKSDCDHYKKGLVVQMNQHVKGFALGERVEVIGVRSGMVRVRRRDGYNDNIKALPLDEAGKFSVYQRDTLEICQGERIRITANTRTEGGHRLENRNLYTVDYIDSEGRLVLENGWKLDRDVVHLQYGYTMTSHAAQGKTVDAVFVAQTSKYSTHASDMKQFYVSISRARSELKIYTDDIELLLENVSRIRERPMATELLQAKEEELGQANEERTSFALGKLDGQQWVPSAQPGTAEYVQYESAKALGMNGPALDVEAAERLREVVREQEPEHKIAMGMRM